MELLEKIRPKKKNRVIDLVQKAGLDVSDWSNYPGPPAANPKYCYEWAFSDEDVAVVLSLWHEDCKVENQRVIQCVNFREIERKFAEIRSHVRAARAKRAGQAILVASRKKLPLRLILVAGQKKGLAHPDAASSKGEKRELDPEFWHLRSYDRNSGEAVLCRGVESTGFEDQFTIRDFRNDSPERRETTGSAYLRDPKVRDWALARAKGRCEFCGQQGFWTSSNSLYLESHHIVSLAEGGSDTVSNVIALCPNHHRQAHFGSNRDELRARFFEILTTERTTE